MEQSEVNESVADTSVVDDPPTIATSSVSPAANAAPIPPCAACGSAGVNRGTGVRVNYIYAIGRIEPRFPRPSVEKEFAQATGRTDTAGLTDRQAVQRVLSEPQNRYLVRQLCWVMSIEGLDTYILQPRDPADFSLLVQSLRQIPKPMDVDVVIGMRGPVAPPELCNGLMLPIIVFDQLYSFDRESLVKAIPKPEKAPEHGFATASEELFDRIMQMADNSGATEEQRALNYLAVRYPAIYAKAAEAFAANSSLTEVHAQPSPLSAGRKIVDVIFSYTNRNTDVVEKSCCRVDVSDEFPFLVTKLSPYYDR